MIEPVAWPKGVGRSGVLGKGKHIGTMFLPLYIAASTRSVAMSSLTSLLCSPLLLPPLLILLPLPLATILQPLLLLRLRLLLLLLLAFTLMMALSPPRPSWFYRLALDPTPGGGCRGGANRGFIRLVNALLLLSIKPP